MLRNPLRTTYLETAGFLCRVSCLLDSAKRLAGKGGIYDFLAGAAAVTL
jgi:hypothetical protein